LRRSLSRGLGKGLKSVKRTSGYHRSGSCAWTHGGTATRTKGSSAWSHGGTAARPKRSSAWSHGSTAARPERSSAWSHGSTAARPKRSTAGTKGSSAGTKGSCAGTEGGARGWGWVACKQQTNRIRLQVCSEVSGGRVYGRVRRSSWWLGQKRPHGDPA